MRLRRGLWRSYACYVLGATVMVLHVVFRFSVNLTEIAASDDTVLPRELQVGVLVGQVKYVRGAAEPVEPRDRQKWARVCGHYGVGDFSENGCHEENSCVFHSESANLSKTF